MLTAAEIAHLLGGKRSGRQWLACCPAHNDRNPSLIIFDGRDKVQVRCLAGCEPVDVLRAIKARMGGYHPVGEEVKDTQADDDREARAHAKLALSIWDNAADARSSDGEAYLWRRGLALPAGDPSHVIRFEPRCPRGRERQPALIVLMSELGGGKPRAIQRIYLKPDCAKDGAMMLGPAMGAAMKLTDHQHTFVADMSYCPRLHICEGFETGLALLYDHKPVWALGSAGAIKSFPALFGVGHLVICADNDDAGMLAAIECMRRWQQADNHSAVIWSPKGNGQDFADIVGGRGDERRQTA